MADNQTLHGNKWKVAQGISQDCLVHRLGYPEDAAPLHCLRYLWVSVLGWRVAIRHLLYYLPLSFVLGEPAFRSLNPLSLAHRSKGPLHRLF